MNSSKNLFHALALLLLAGNLTILGMDEPMKLDKRPNTTRVNKEPKLKFDNKWRSLIEIENNAFIFAVIRTFYEGGKTKAYFRNQKPETVFSQHVESHERHGSWAHDLPTPERHCSTCNVVDAAFSDDGSKAIFAQYGHDSDENKEPGVLVATFDLKTEKMSQYTINGNLGQICGDFGKIIVSNDGKYCARLLKTSAFQSQPASTTVIIDELTHDGVHYSTIKVDHSLDATDISFTKNNTTIFVKGTNGSESFEIIEPEHGHFIPINCVTHGGYTGGKIQEIHSISAPQDKCGRGRAPFMGLCDSALIEKLQEAGFRDMQPEDLAVYSETLYKEIGLKVIPAKYFTKQKATYALLFDGTHVRFHPNPFIRDNTSPGYFTLVIFTYNQNKDIIPEQSRYQLIQEVIRKGHIVPTGNSNESCFLQESFTNENLTVSKVASSYKLNEELINRLYT